MKTYQKVFHFSILDDYQTNVKVKYQNVNFEIDKYNSYQNLLYKRALFGLSAYSKDELERMSSVKKKRIHFVYLRAQNILNSWKQDIENYLIASLLQKTFFHSKFVKDYVDKFALEKDSNYFSRTDFKSLGISKEDIIKKLIFEKILPSNFYQLKVNESK